ncbi:hypothetical protein C7M84_020244 [Penaeus vannamei]|uniref:WSC domain-containing protein n=1 Tax=Penaeus vannamei TaxID=6689 RepID=A0A3R7NMB0_PENVA|nr:hypothetical protein C7M84_020244 [Penaeus vannamei]
MAYLLTRALSQWLLLQALLWPSTSAGGNAEQTFPACFEDDMTLPVLTTSAGGFRPEELLLTTCGFHCGANGYMYVAVEEAAFCFCLASVKGLKSSTKCDLTCADGKQCGGDPGHFSVWTVKSLTAPPVTPSIRLAFSDSTDLEKEVPVNSLVVVTITIDLPYLISFGDGGGEFERDSSNTSASNIYFLEGTYLITVTEPWSGGKAALTVVVVGLQNKLRLECPSLVLTGIPFTCSFDSLYGSFPIVQLWTDETNDFYNYTVPDLESRIYGHSWPSPHYPTSSNPPVTSIDGSDCSVRVMDTQAVGEDEYLAALHSKANGGKFDIRSVYESCSPACPSNGFRKCTTSQHLCSDACVAVDTCPVNTSISSLAPPSPPTHPLQTNPSLSLQAVSKPNQPLGLASKSCPESRPIHRFSLPTNSENDPDFLLGPVPISQPILANHARINPSISLPTNSENDTGLPPWPSPPSRNPSNPLRIMPRIPTNPSIFSLLLGPVPLNVSLKEDLVFDLDSYQRLSLDGNKSTTSDHFVVLNLALLPARSWFGVGGCKPSYAAAKVAYRSAADHLALGDLVLSSTGASISRLSTNVAVMTDWTSFSQPPPPPKIPAHNFRHGIDGGPPRLTT